MKKLRWLGRITMILLSTYRQTLILRDKENNPLNYEKSLNIEASFVKNNG